MEEDDSQCSQEGLPEEVFELTADLLDAVDRLTNTLDTAIEIAGIMHPEVSHLSRTHALQTHGDFPKSQQPTKVYTGKRFRSRTPPKSQEMK